ncbi:MAG TPA: hypothetical protein PK113_06055, partial [Bacillota bacterium]|nr:hypothetical protein [Bacillota bacterium]
YFVQSKLQPFFIDEVMTANDVLTMLYPDVQDYFTNYFSLDVTHILVYLDYDEDGIPDNFDDYKASLSAAELDAFSLLEANLEQAIDEYDGTFDALVAEYAAATRDDETWGAFKQNGLFLLTESLNQVDSSDSTVTHSLTYSGTYGVKDTYDPAFVDALIALYDTYQQDQNLDKSEMYSNGLVASSFGLHYIMVQQGDDFDKPTAKFTEEDSDNPVYSVGSENENDMPTMAQVELYAQYKLYSMVFDLNDSSIAETYGITVPNLPSSVSDALDVYLGTLLDSVYVIGTLNVDMATRMVDGEFVSGNTYSSQTNADLMADIANVGTIYYDVIFGDYEN